MAFLIVCIIGINRDLVDTGRVVQDDADTRLVRSIQRSDTIVASKKLYFHVRLNVMRGTRPAAPDLGMLS